MPPLPIRTLAVRDVNPPRRFFSLQSATHLGVIIGIPTTRAPMHLSVLDVARFVTKTASACLLPLSLVCVIFSRSLSEASTRPPMDLMVFESSSCALVPMELPSLLIMKAMPSSTPSLEAPFFLCAASFNVYPRHLEHPL